MTAAIRRLTRNDGIDPIDGTEINAVRRLALAYLERTEADLSDAELFAQQSEDLWFADFCLDSLHRLPSEVEPILLCREYTLLSARGLVREAIQSMTSFITSIPHE